MNTNLLKIALYQSAGVLVYSGLVALLMTNGEELFGKMSTVLSSVAFLLLFVVSTAIVGSLVVVKPLMFYLDGKKKDAISLLIYTISILFILTIIFLFVLWLIK